ncbi:hypothetical protein E4U10_000694 [Claviceps purpurea]|nr:hypothetical protein E4U28_001854 [Claviceps purpurea]KAG6176283.1 hypothetical protein E4U10_000694 [Claviceps purpurea]KAG6213467.1 hypothetical protein E4U26_000716 [Claviceps purpurea]
MTPVSCKSPEQDELPEGRGRFGLCACRRATDRRRESLLFTTPTGLNDRGIKISLRLSHFEIDRRRFASVERGRIFERRKNPIMVLGLGAGSGSIALVMHVGMPYDLIGSA